MEEKNTNVAKLIGQILSHYGQGLEAIHMLLVYLEEHGVDDDTVRLCEKLFVGMSIFAFSTQSGIDDLGELLSEVEVATEFDSLPGAKWNLGEALRAVAQESEENRN